LKGQICHFIVYSTDPDQSVEDESSDAGEQETAS